MRQRSRPLAPAHAPRPAGCLVWPTPIPVAFLLPAARGGKPADPRSKADLLLGRPRQAEVRSEVKLPAHPESFQVDPESRRIYVNVPDEHQIAVVEARDDGLKASAAWPVTAAEKNFAMALDAASSRLFVACRKPACLPAYDTASGKMLASVPCVGDVDDLFYDAQLRRLYAIGGEGFVDVFEVAAHAEKLTLLAHILTAAKARTGLLIPALNLLAVAVPHTGEHPASILLFRVNR